MRASRRTRLLRGFAGASVSTFVALASHVWVGGQMPGMLGIVVPWLLSFMLCTLLSGIRLSAFRLTASVLLSQALFHSLFVLGAITPRSGVAPHVHGPLALPSAGAALIVPEDAGMWVAHGIAAAITVLALHRGERLLQALTVLASVVARWISRAVVAAPALPLIPSRARWAVQPAPLRTEPRFACLKRRGPPLLVV
ncbi:hypothetical protein AB0N59_04545 [Microbacterium sp. NPDC089321]|uniref:hypothetical protein n=1 Tax=Microbacterium sp. NPDC089321 TaxID=3155183 RepID=UPI003437981A